MIGNFTTFTDLDKTMSGRVRFGDGSLVESEGHGMVLFAVNGGHHRALMQVYWIPCIKSNIVSIGQLDEIVYSTQVEYGMMMVLDRQHNLLAKVKRNLK
jgi:hypothetical protein